MVRAGAHVLRPAGPQTATVRAFLRALRAAGFDGAPMPIGVDDDGRERLEFIEGDVPLAPYPAWSQTDAALASVARLLRRMHDAGRGFDPADGAPVWNEALADPAGGGVVCHNDVELSNVVFRDGVAVAFVDFEFAAPGRPVYDLAQLVRLCVPIEDDVDQERLGWGPADRAARFRLAADAYGLDGPGREALVGAVDDALDRIEACARRTVVSGDARAIDQMRRTGGMEKYDRRRRWWSAHRAAFTAALG